LFREEFNNIDSFSTDILDDYSQQSSIVLDVPFVPTDEHVVEAMLNLADVGPQDVLYDLGSGDGRVLITAARDRDTRGVGVDLDPLRIADAMESAAWSHVEYLVDFIEDDIFNVDFSEATVVFLYLFQSVNVQLRPYILSQLRPGSRVVSHAFDMGDWKADDCLKLSGATIYKWIVPAQVAGVWEWAGPDGKLYRVELKQKYQRITGSAWLDGKKAHLKSAKLCGGRLDLELGEDTITPLNRFTLNFSDKKIRSIIAK